MPATKARKGKRSQPVRDNLSALDSLFGKSENKADSAIFVPIEKIKPDPDQPRRYFDKQAHAELSNSIRRLGILQPLILREVDGSYEIVAGERRYRAALEVGLTEVPAIARPFSPEDAMQIALIENLQREDLNPVEITNAILQLMCLRLSLPQEDAVALIHRIAYKEQTSARFDDLEKEQYQLILEVLGLLGKFGLQAFKSHYLSTLNMPKEILNHLEQGNISISQANAVKRIKDPAVRMQMLAETLAENLTIEEIKERVHGYMPEIITHEQAFRKRIKGAINKATKVALKDSKKMKRMEKILQQLEELAETSIPAS